MKAGMWTTEFWLTLISQVLGLLAVLGIIQASEIGTLEDALGKCVTAVFLFLTNAWIVVNYIKGRVMLKNNGDEGKTKSQGLFPPLVGLLVLVLLLPGVAPAAEKTCFGGDWRRSIEQRLIEHQQLIISLLQGKQSQPALPPVIVLPPALQQLPIEKSPRQELPIAGEPKQWLPIPGEPRQVLPVPGSPRQELPIPGEPRQELPIPGRPPVSYTVYALYR